MAAAASAYAAQIDVEDSLPSTASSSSELRKRSEDAETSGAPEQLARLSLEAREASEAAEAAGLLEGLEVGKKAIQENSYLRQNVEYLRQRKRQLEHQVQAFDSRFQAAEAQKKQYKALFEELQHQEFQRSKAGLPSTGTCNANSGGGELEILSLQQQVGALQMLKDALNVENVELQERVQALEQSKQVSKASCVICMDNLANVVCLPCKHLAMCSLCSQHSYDECEICPICRGDISDRMLIYMP